MSKFLDVAVSAARKAGKHAFSKMNKIKNISRKSGYTDLVTNVDRECEQIIIDLVRKEYPSHTIIAEESGKDPGKEEISWVIDPIDGTVNYAHSFPFYCTSIGVMIDGRVRSGVVFDPFRNELFTAEEGEGAFLNKKRISVSRIDELRDSLVATGFAYQPSDRIEVLPYFRDMLKRAQAVRRAGSAALDLCYVACGRLDGFWEFGLKPWDMAAGQLIVSEAGGEVTTLDGKEFSIFFEKIAASNGRVHTELLEVLNAVSN